MLAGSAGGFSGSMDGGALTGGTLFGPSGVAVDAVDGSTYIADTSNSRVRVLSAAGVLSTLAGANAAHGSAVGFADGDATSALFRPSAPGALVVDNMGQLFMLDSANCAVRSVNTTTGATTTLAGGGVPSGPDTTGACGFVNAVGTNARFSSATRGLARALMGAAAPRLFVSDGNVIRAINLSDASVSSFAGGGGGDTGTARGHVDGTGTAVLFEKLYGLAMDEAGSVLYAGEQFYLRRLNIAVSPPTVTTLAGRGQTCSSNPYTSSTGTSACLPTSVFPGFDPATGDLLVAGATGTLNLLQRIETASALNPVTLLGGGDSLYKTFGTPGVPSSVGLEPSYSAPSFIAPGVAVLPYGNCVLQVNNVTGVPTFAVIAGTTIGVNGSVCVSDYYADGAALAGGAGTVYAVAYEASSARVLLVESFRHVRSLTLGAEATLRTLAGGGRGAAAGFADGVGSAAAFDAPIALTLTRAAGRATLWVADTNNHALRVIDVATAAVTTLGGGGGGVGGVGTAAGWVDGVGTAAGFNGPTGLSLSADGGALLVADTANNIIRRVALADGSTTTLAGGGLAGGCLPGAANGVGSAARLAAPQFIDAAGGVAYATELTNSDVRRVNTTSGAVSGWVGGGASGAATAPDTFVPAVGTAALLTSAPAALAVIAEGGAVVISVSTTLLHADVSTTFVSILAGPASAYLSATGFVDGAGTSARFHAVTGLAWEAATQTLWIADSSNNAVRALAYAGAVVTTAAGASTGIMGGIAGSIDGVGTAARFNSPAALALDAGRRILYILDRSNYRVRALALTTFAVTTLFGAGGTAASFHNGPAATARIGYVSSIVLRADALYLADLTYNQVRAYNLSTGTLATLAGGGRVAALAAHADGVGSAALFALPSAVASNGSVVWVGDAYNNALRAIDVASQRVSTLANPSLAAGFADGASGAAAAFAFPAGLTLLSACGDNASQLLLADGGNNALRLVDAGSGATRTVLAGAPRAPSAATLGYADGAATAALFNVIRGVAQLAGGDLIASDAVNGALRAVARADGGVGTLAGAGPLARGRSDGPALAAALAGPAGIAADVATGVVYFGDLGGSNGNQPYIRYIRNDSAAAGGTVGTLAGSGSTGTANGAATSARFSRTLAGLAVGADVGGLPVLWVADAGNNRIRAVALPGGDTSTYAGSSSGFIDGIASAARFRKPYGIAFRVAPDASRMLYVSVADSNAIRALNITAGTVATLAGGGGAAYGTTSGRADGLGLAATFREPTALALSVNGATLYVADSSNSLIRKIDLSATPAVVGTLAGGGLTGTSIGTWDGVGAGATLAFPSAATGAANMAADATALYVPSADRIRRVELATGAVSTLCGSGARSRSVPGAAPGAGTAAGLTTPRGLAIDAGGRAYLLDAGSGTLRALDGLCAAAADAGAALNSSVLAGGVSGAAQGGVGSNAKFSGAANGIAVLASPAAGALEVLVVADAANNVLRNATLA